tara:strand:+ start:1624 stop:1896 length:273 start_codon:yes stop_codon:yes gene_type:complete
MAELNASPPSLPLPPEKYESRYFSQLNNILRLYFNQLNNPGDMGGATLNLNLDTLPTEADFANLRLGDVYRDTQDGVQDGSQMLRIKTST